MNREYEQDELIELGSVSSETKGRTVGHDDFQGGLIEPTGISDD